MAGEEKERAESADEGKREDERDVDLLERRAAEGEEHAEREQQPGGSARAHLVGEGVELVQGETAEKQHQGVHAVDPDQDEADDQGQDHERAEDAHHQRAESPTAAHGGIARGQLATTSADGRPPNRRTLDAYSARAAFRSSSPKSGQSVSLTSISA